MEPLRSFFSSWTPTSPGSTSKGFEVRWALGGEVLVVSPFSFRAKKQHFALHYVLPFLHVDRGTSQGNQEWERSIFDKWRRRLQPAPCLLLSLRDHMLQ
jgi:hypothetical protein